MKKKSEFRVFKLLTRIKFRKFKRWLERFWEKNTVSISITALSLLLLVIFFWNNIVISIEPGYKGVLWRRLTGTELNEVYGEGVHVILPIDKMFIYDTRIQNHSDSMKILTAEGLLVNIEYSCRYHPLRDSVATLHQKIGHEYADKLVKPEVQAAAISIIGNYTPQKLYQMSTLFIQSTIKHFLIKQLSNYNIVLDDYIIRKLQLPDKIVKAIEQKLSAEQMSLEYEYRLNIEAKEKQRRIIEAQGIEEFEKISNISILKWRGLQVTSEIAKSENSKVIIIGTGEDQLPVILNSK